MNANNGKLCFFIVLILAVLMFQPAIAQPLPPSEHIVSYEQFISSNDYTGEYISMSAKIEKVEWSGKGYKYTIQLMPLEKEINKSVNGTICIQVKNRYKVIDPKEDFIRDETIGIVLKKGYNIVVIGKAGELKEKERVIYVDTKTILHGDTVISVNDEGTVILLLKKEEYNEIKDDIHPKVLIHPKDEPMQEITEYTYVITRKIKHNSSADIFAVGSYHKLFLLDYNSELLDRDYDVLFDPIDPYPNHYDIDKDKLSDKEELELGTDPGKNDTDKDGLSDWEEVKKGTDGYITNPLNPDTDGDTLSDYVETHGFERGGITFFTDPTNPDTDGDRIWDGTDPDPAPIDTDGDGLLDREEAKIGTDINKKDTDGEGLTDFEEVKGTMGYKTDPLKKDTDEDGLSDKEEIDRGLNPLNPDTDGDELSDKEELKIGTDPKNPDTDGDGIKDGDDKFPLDWDNDGWTDAYERDVGTDPYNHDTDGDGIIDPRDNFPLFNNNIIHGLSCIPVVVSLILFILHIKIGLTSNRKNKIKEEREKFEEVKKKILELAEEKRGYIFLKEIADKLDVDIKTAKSYMKKLVRMKIAKKDKEDAYIFPEITKKDMKC